jgi:hypothetical protein
VLSATQRPFSESGSPVFLLHPIAGIPHGNSAGNAELMYESLGFASVEEMIREGYKLAPEEIDIAVEWLRLNPTEEPVPIGVTLRDGPGRPPKGEENPCNITRIKYGTAEHVEARLLRDNRQDLYQSVKSNKLSHNAAAILAGWRTKPKPRTPLQQLRSAWKKASETEREAFKTEIE